MYRDQAGSIDSGRYSRNLFDLRRALRQVVSTWLRVADGLRQHLTQLCLRLRRFPRDGLTFLISLGCIVFAVCSPVRAQMMMTGAGPSCGGSCGGGTTADVLYLTTGTAGTDGIASCINLVFSG
jgi:hypothetical protein